jgi:hypothetical protein
VTFRCGITDSANDSRGGRKPKEKCTASFDTMAELMAHLLKVHRVRLDVENPQVKQ